MKIKKFFKNINDKYFYGKYNGTYNYINKKSSVVEYIIKFLFILIMVGIFLYVLFNDVLYSLLISFIITIFFINEIVLNAKKIGYESYILSQLSIYTSQMSLLVTYNNIYGALKDVVNFLDNPIRNDIETVITKIDNGVSIAKAFEPFNEKYNNRTITLFNQTLDLFDEHGNSDAETVLQIICDEMNLLKIKKDKFFKFKKEWRLNFYIVAILSLVMPLILRFMITDIYNGFMSSFGKFIMLGIIIVNLVVIKKVELVYRDQSIGEGGYR